MKGKHVYVLMVAALTMVVVVLVGTTVAADSAPNNCSHMTCGGIEIPYPFGIDLNNSSSNCFMAAEMDVLFDVSKYCSVDNYTKPTLTSDSYVFSSKENKFVTVGYDSYGYFNSYDGENEHSTTGCLTSVIGHERLINNGTCSGIGCCQVDIPPRMRYISIQATNFNKNSSDFCSYAFVAKNGSYSFSSTHLSQGLPFNRSPVVLDWTIEDNNCSTAPSNNMGIFNYYGCKNNSYCDDKDKDFGYRCICNQGFEGNPYEPNIGCTDTDECEKNKHGCKTKANCKNTIGNYTCFCPRGQSGDGTKERGCQTKATPILPLTVIGVGATLILLLVGTFSYLIYHKRKFIKMKEKFFEQNGGLILKQKLSTREDSSTESTKIFTQDQLNKATKDFDENLIIGKGGFETEVPLLVYEFVTNGTLSGFIHTQSNKVNNETWKTRLKIAAEVAETLSYLHSYASIPIIHRDVKSDNILLDRTNTAKVSDFGASRLVPIDQTEIATMVQGTIGYLDPEYMQTSQLTEKSDVYSFGVVLVELLTGEKPFCFVIQDGLWNEENKQEIKEVAVLAAKCLRLRGEERPSMKEVAMELEGMRLMNKHSWIKDDSNVEESRYLLHESSSSIYEPGDSITHGDIGYDSLKDHVLIALDDGR
ncbi:wall associated kinase-like protein, putative [Medicago truncatula]|uniref:Wall associated kinase-like protein, putative n=1 Tax=Medicago truncatula TaxID=3880 RepID=A0A072VCQ2_MEDTR|nr:wall associated kinase-like protein, putative [Medicago truncatula]